MTEPSRVRVAVNGYGVIGKRVADGVTLQPDMELVGVADIILHYRIRIALERGYPVFASTGRPRWTLRVLPGADHHPLLRDPAWCVRAIGAAAS